MQTIIHGKDGVKSPFAGITRITIGRGNARTSVEMPLHGTDRLRASEDLKNYVTRPKLFAATHK